MSAAGDNSASPAGSPTIRTIFGDIPVMVAPELPEGMIRMVSGDRVTDFDIDPEAETATAIASYPKL
jgi:hypothetical protein